jgi:hypothetical protein
MSTKTLCEANSLVDELAPLFYQKAECSRFRRIGLNASQLVAMAKQKIKQQAGIMRISYDVLSTAT